MLLYLGLSSSVAKNTKVTMHILLPTLVVNNDLIQYRGDA